MAVPMDPIEHIVYHYGTVEVVKDQNYSNGRVLLIFKTYPFLPRMPVQLRATGINFRDACENLIREIQAALVADPPDLYE